MRDSTLEFPKLEYAALAQAGGSSARSGCLRLSKQAGPEPSWAGPERALPYEGSCWETGNSAPGKDGSTGMSRSIPGQRGKGPSVAGSREEASGCQAQVVALVSRLRGESSEWVGD